MPTIQIICTERRPGPGAPNRECSEEGCPTRLSQWNETDRCWLHNGWRQIVKPSEQTAALEDLMAEMR